MGLAFAAAPACDDDTPDGPIDRMMAEAARSAAATLSTLQCEHIEQCGCASSLRPEGECEAGWRDRWEARLAYAIAEGLTYDAGCMAAHAEQHERWSCASPISGAALCNEFCAVFHGAGIPGDPCEALDPVASDCAQGLTCHRGTCVRPCEALGGLAEDASCLAEFASGPEPFDACGAGGSCDLSTGTCQGVGSSEGCAAATACAAGERCVEQFDAWSAPPWTVECRRPAGDGAACDDGVCDTGLLCFDGTCRQPGAAGDSCRDGRPCRAGLLCGAEGTCAPPPDREGQTCVFGRCGEGLWCDPATDTCAPQVGPTERCTGHDVCRDGYCPQGICLPLPEAGETCGLASACAVGLRCDGERCVPAIGTGIAACNYPGW